jgi:dCMP deaminase
MKWDDYFMEMAWLVATKSKDPSTKVGCVITGPGNEVRGTGYNGLPRRVADLPERMERPAKYLWTSHAEENAIAHAARVGIATEGCTIYVTHAPCSRCTRMLIQAGIERVYVGRGTVKGMDAQEFIIAERMFDEALVEVTVLPKDV